jgi:DNA-binding transcriptional MocR family regulator
MPSSSRGRETIALLYSVMTNDSSSDRLAGALRALLPGLPPGGQLPSTRSLVTRYQVSPVTVSRVIARLAAEGVIVTEPGRGTFAAPPRHRPEPDVGWQTVALGERRMDATAVDRLITVPGIGTLVLSSGYLADDLQPVRAITAAAQRAVRRPGVWGLAPAAGLPELRRLLAETVAADPADALIVPGGQAGLSAALRALAPPGSPVLVGVPTYLGALVAARSAGLVPIPVPTDADGIRPELLAEAFARTRATLLYTQPTFVNPTGAVLSAPRRAAVLAAAQDAGAFILEDDWARHLGFDGPVPPPLFRDDTDGHVVHLLSLTKPAAPSLRIGALIARGPAAERLAAVRVVEDFFVSRPLQETAVELLSSPSWPRHLTALGAALRSRRDVLVAAVHEQLPQVELARVPTGGLHLWARLPIGVDDGDITLRAQMRGVVVGAGRPYFAGEPPGSYLRLTFGGASAADLVEGIRRLAGVMSQP